MSPLYFAVTIDTEEEWDWNSGFSDTDFSVENIKCIPKFQEFCNSIGIKPTYLISYPIATDEECVKILGQALESGQCEIGGHLHPWCTPPIEETISVENSHSVNLPLKLVQTKIANLTKVISDNFGIQPISFRSGRWGINGDLLKILVDEGYQIDVSVRPFFSDIAFSYHNAMETPYWPDYTNILTAGNQREIFEMPASEGFNIQNFALGNRLHRLFSTQPFTYFHVIGILWHLNLFKKLSISPETEETSEMIACIDAYLAKGNKYIDMHFHSSCLLPGGSPYFKSDSDVRMLFKRIEDVIDYIKSKAHVNFCTVSEAKTQYLKEL